jgi:hypothetical protein
LLAKWERCGEGEAKYCVMEEECDRRIWLSWCWIYVILPCDLIFPTQLSHKSRCTCTMKTGRKLKGELQTVITGTGAFISSGLQASHQCCCHWHNIASRLACAENLIAFGGWIDRLNKYHCIIFQKVQERATFMAVKETGLLCRFSYNKMSSIECDPHLMRIKSLERKALLQWNTHFTFITLMAFHCLTPSFSDPKRVISVVFYIHLRFSSMYQCNHQILWLAQITSSFVWNSVQVVCSKKSNRDKAVLQKQGMDHVVTVSLLWRCTSLNGNTKSASLRQDKGWELLFVLRLAVLSLSFTWKSSVVVTDTIMRWQWEVSFHQLSLWSWLLSKISFRQYHAYRENIDFNVRE